MEKKTIKGHMNLTSISMVKNESDIIESFIRYNINFLDLMLVLDNGSTDETIDILNLLIEEGLPICLIKDPNPSRIQSEMMTSLLNLVVDSFAPSLIIPLDADEFLFSTEGNPRSSLERLSVKKVHYVPWITYVPTGRDDKNEPFVPKRIVHRMEKEPPLYRKVIIPGNLVKKYNLVVTQGNHDVTNISNRMKSSDNNLLLAHYPVRSSTQAISKYLVTWLAYLAKHEKVKGQGSNCKAHYQEIKNKVSKNEGYSISDEELTAMAISYIPGDNILETHLLEIPLSLDYCKTKSLKYKEKISPSYLNNLLNYTEYLACRYAISSPSDRHEHSKDTYINQLEESAVYKKLSCHKAVNDNQTRTKGNPFVEKVSKLFSWSGKK